MEIQEVNNKLYGRIIMIPKEKLNTISYILIYASIWGFLEATLGWSLQFITFQVSGFVMFPLAMYILLSAYRKLGSASSLLWIGLAAGMIKLINLLLPGLPPIKTINPAIALVWEACFAAVLIPLLTREHRFSRLGYAALSSLGWRSAFLLSSAAIGFLGGIPISLLNSPRSMLTFLFLYGLVGALITWVVIMVEEKPRLSLNVNLRRPAILALPMLGASLGCQYFL
jgi:hypothetical protein